MMLTRRCYQTVTATIKSALGNTGFADDILLMIQYFQCRLVVVIKAEIFVLQPSTLDHFLNEDLIHSYQNQTLQQQREVYLLNVVILITSQSHGVHELSGRQIRVAFKINQIFFH